MRENAPVALNVQIPDDMKMLLELYAREHGCSVAHAVRTLFDSHPDFPKMPNGTPWAIELLREGTFRMATTPMVVDTATYELVDGEVVETTTTRPIVGWGEAMPGLSDGDTDTYGVYPYVCQEANSDAEHHGLGLVPATELGIIRAVRHGSE